MPDDAPATIRTGPAADSAPPATPLPCIDCGYDLEGQFGDPVRCPECGYRATRAELASDDARSRRQLQRIESRIIAGLVAGLSLLLGLTLLLMAFARVTSNGPRDAAIVLTAVLLSILLASRRTRRR